MTAEQPLYFKAQPTNGRQIIKTGDLFYVRIQEEEAEKMEPCFAVQWALIRMVAMVGAGVLTLEQTPNYFGKNGKCIGESGLPAIDFEKAVEKVLKEGLRGDMAILECGSDPDSE